MKTLVISFIQFLANVVLIALGSVAIYFILNALMPYAETVLYCAFAYVFTIIVLALMPRNIDIKNKIQRVSDLVNTIHIGIH